VKTPYRISEKALEDLEDIWLYTFKTWSQEQADRYYNLLINEFEYSASNFDYGRAADHIKQGYRTSKIKSHLIFYQKSDDGVIEIIRVLHENMNVENRLR
jgi:toxin ParE1/3/4